MKIEGPISTNNIPIVRIDDESYLIIGAIKEHVKNLEEGWLDGDGLARLIARYVREGVPCLCESCV